MIRHKGKTFEQFLRNFKTTRWYKINSRTINGFYVHHKNKGKIYYNNKKIELQITKTEFELWCDKHANELKVYWEKEVTPSVDRIDSYGHYNINNMRILSWDDNTRLAREQQAINAVKRKEKIARLLRAYCPACGKQLKLKSKEPIADFKKRMFCGISCHTSYENRKKYAAKLTWRDIDQANIEIETGDNWKDMEGM